MRRRNFIGSAAVALCIVLTGTLALSQSQAPTEGPAAGESPAWFLQGSFPDPGGRTVVDSGGQCHGTASRRRIRWPARRAAPPPAPGRRHAVARRCAATGLAARARRCSACSGSRRWATRSPTRTCCLLASAVSPRSRSIRKDNLWVFQRADAGKPQLFKFDPNHKLILQVGPDVIGYQDKAHGMAVDAEDNVWITAANGATVMKISPEGKLLLTIGASAAAGAIGTKPKDSGCSGSR